MEQVLYTSHDLVTGQIIHGTAADLVPQLRKSRGPFPQITAALDELQDRLTRGEDTEDVERILGITISRVVL